MAPDIEPRYLAGRLIGSARLAKVLMVQPCWLCGEAKAEAHHPDYEKYDEIQWLCRFCHKGVHSGRIECNQAPIRISYRPDKWPPQQTRIQDAKKILVTEELERVKIVNNSGTLYIRVPSGLKAEYGLQGGDELIYARHIASGRLVLLVGEVKL